jgi:hypothetical protein
MSGFGQRGPWSEGMAGQVKKMLELIIVERSKGDDVLAKLTRAKLILKGFDPSRFTLTTPDDPATVDRVMRIARELGVMLK